MLTLDLIDEVKPSSACQPVLDWFPQGLGTPPGTWGFAVLLSVQLWHSSQCSVAQQGSVAECKSSVEGDVRSE